MAKNEVIVDRLLSIREVEPPPPQHWEEIDKAEADRIIKAHIQGYLRECAGKPICMPNSEMPKSK